MIDLLTEGLIKIVTGFSALLFTLTASPEATINLPHDNTAPEPEASQIENAGDASGPSAEGASNEQTAQFSQTPESQVANLVTVPEETSYINTSQAHTDLKKALVNIYCTINTTKGHIPITASGVTISPDGVVITNAHVAQYILLSEFVTKDSIDCAVRTGSPARETYKPQILYISPEWVEDHAEDILESVPEGTGRDDYAFLLPKNDEDVVFDFVSPEVSENGINPGGATLLGAYPAGILDSLTIEKQLYAQTLKGEIKKVLTFGDDEIDVLSTGGTYLSQRGSSGGAVLDENGALIGIFVTSTQNKDLGGRDLRAITLSHIERSLRSYAGLSVKALMSGDVFEISHEFNEKVSPILADILLGEIKSK